MTSIPAAAPATTSTGAPLPLVALPQGELLTINADDIPLVRDALGDGVHFRPLRLDLENGEWVVLATFAPGARIPLHYHTGAVDAWTISGSWHYKEYAEQPQNRRVVPVRAGGIGAHAGVPGIQHRRHRCAVPR